MIGRIGNQQKYQNKKQQSLNNDEAVTGGLTPYGVVNGINGFEVY